MLMAMTGETVKKTPGSPEVGGATLPVDCGPLGTKLSRDVVNLTFAQGVRERPQVMAEFRDRIERQNRQ